MRRALVFLLFGGGAFFLFEGGSSFLSQFQTEIPQAALSDASLRISFPRLGEELRVSPTATDKDLLHGPGHLSGTAEPGEHGNMVIAGHRDTHFRLLKDIRKGDEIIIDRGWHEYRYRVIATIVVRPTQTRALAPSSAPLLTLVTCYPFYYVGPAPKRFIVRAALIATITHAVGSCAPGAQRHSTSVFRSRCGFIL